MTEQTLPVDPESERALCGSIWAGIQIQDPEARSILCDLPPEAFFFENHRKIWQCMCKLVGACSDVPSELALIREVCGSNSDQNARSAIMEIVSIGSDLMPQPLAERVREFHARRAAITAARSVMDAAYDTCSLPDEMGKRANEAFLAITRGASSVQRFWCANDMMPVLESKEGFRTGISAEKLLWTGIQWVDDKVIGGPGNITIISGRPGACKTAIALQARNVTALHGIPAGFFSLEMDEAEVKARDAAWWLSDPDHGDVFSYKSMLLGHYDAGRALNALRKHIPSMQNAIGWTHSSGIPIGKLAAHITEAVHAYGIRLAIVDYFQYIGLTRQKGDSEASAYSANSKALKKLAQDLKIHLVVLSQLNRDKEDGTRPTMSDLKETSQLEQDASMILMTWKDKEGRLQATMPKNREGEGVVQLQLDVTWPCLRIKALPEQETDLFPPKR